MTLENILERIVAAGYYPCLHPSASDRSLWRAEISYGPTIYDKTFGESKSPILAVMAAYEELQKRIRK